MFYKFSVILAAFIVTAIPALAVEFPAHENFITDISGYLSDSTESQLNERLKAYESETGTEIAVAIISLIPEGMSANEYATALGNEWGVGKAVVDNGAILLIETDDVPGQRDVYIAAGSQLEGGLTDLEATDIVDYVIIPQFQSGDFDAGVVNGVEAMIAALNSESFTNLRMGSSGSSEKTDEDWIGLSRMLIFFIIPWFGAVLGRSEAIWPGGALGATSGLILGAVFDYALAGFLSAAIGLGALGLLFDWMVSSNYKGAKKKGKDPSWWAGGGSGWGGGSSGSSGGFSGFSGGGFSGGGGGGKW